MSLYFLGEAAKIGKNVEVSVKHSGLQRKCVAPMAQKNHFSCIFYKGIAPMGKIYFDK
jgi:hypothetical protein